MRFEALLGQMGFQPKQLHYTLRTAAGACLSLLIAWALGLEHPQWTAMSVWIASQPTRGMLLEKSLFRALGTVAGTVFGVTLVVVSGDQPWVLVVGLAAWVSLCAGMGSVWRGYASYGAILAGYSAAMVSLLDSAHPDHIFLLGMDRFLTVMVGISVALAIGWFFTPVQHPDALRQRVRQLTANVLRNLANKLRGEHQAGDTELRAVWSEIAAIEDLLDPHAFGSLKSRKVARSFRQVLLAQVSAMLWLRSGAVPQDAGGLSQALTDGALCLEREESDEATLQHLRQALSFVPGDSALGEVLQRLLAALGQAQTDDSLAERPLRIFESQALHRDWVVARQAALRALVVLSLVGSLWAITGWKPAAYTLLGTSVMISLFSTFDSPALMMRSVIIGHMMGLGTALVCRWLVWPLAHSQLELLFLMMPFIVVGALMLAHRRTAPFGYDYTFLLLIMLQPAFPLKGEFQTAWVSALAMLVAPCLALLAYRYIFPVSTAHRAKTIMRMMLSELQEMAADPRAVAHQGVWEARLYHRLIRLIRLSGNGADTHAPTLDYGLGVLHLGTFVLHVQAWMGNNTLDGAHLRRLKSTLQRLSRLQSQPHRAMFALERLIAGRHARHLPQPELLQQALKGCAQLITARPLI